MKKIVKLFIIILITFFLCSCAKKEEENDFNVFVEENNGIFDLIKDIKIEYNNGLNFENIYNSVEPSVIKVLSTTDDKNLFSVYFYKMDECVKVSLMSEDTIVYEVDIDEEDIKGLEKILNESSSNTLGGILESLKEEYDVDVSDIFYYKFSISDFTYERDSKLYIVKNDALIKYIVSVANKIKAIIPTNKDDKSLTEKDVYDYLENKHISFDVKFGYEKKHINRIIVALKQENEEEYDIGLSKTNKTQDVIALLTIDMKYEKNDNEDELKEIDLSLSISQNELNTEGVSYIEQKSTTDVMSSVEFDLDFVIKKDYISINCHMNMESETDEVSSAYGKKASSTLLNNLQFDCSYVYELVEDTYKMLFQINGNELKSINGTYLVITTEYTGSCIYAQSAQVKAYDNKDNYNVSFQGSCEVDFNPAKNLLNANIDVKSKSNDSISVAGKIEFENWFKELDILFKSKTSKNESLNYRILYSKISKEELPVVNDEIQ